MDKPVWIEYILRNTTAYTTFLAYCDEQRDMAVSRLINSVRTGNPDAPVHVGQIDFIESMKQIVNAYRREEEEDATIQESRYGARTA